MQTTPPKPPRSLGPSAFVLAAALVLFLLSSIFGWGPAGCRTKDRFGNKSTALNALRQLASATHLYAVTHDGRLPDADLDGEDTWENVALPSADSVWYNALPRLLKVKSVGDFAREDRRAAFYT